VVGRMRAIAVCVMVWLGGCAYLPAGPLVDAPSTKVAPPPHVYLIRGFEDWYSTGIETLAAELRESHIDAKSYGESQWESLGDSLANGRLQRTRLVLIGFSYGADDVIHIARRLGSAGYSVQLLVTIDPVTPGSIPANVKRCVNFYQSNGIWDFFPWLRGVPVAREAGDKQQLANINLRTHPELLEPGTSHATIAGNEKMHAAIIRLVQSAAQ